MSEVGKLIEDRKDKAMPESESNGRLAVVVGHCGDYPTHDNIQ